MGRPSTPNTKYFQRTLSSPEKQIMLAAGEGNLCRGFENILAFYQHVHNRGYRPTMDMSILNIDHATTNSPETDQDHVRDSMSRSIDNV
jgi:hypothetical protein